MGRDYSPYDHAGDALSDLFHEIEAATDHPAAAALITRNCLMVALGRLPYPQRAEFIETMRAESKSYRRTAAEMRAEAAARAADLSRSATHEATL